MSWHEKRRVVVGFVYSRALLPPRLGAGPDVQRRVRPGEPSPGCGLQAPSRGQLWHLSEPQQEAEAEPEEARHRHGESRPPRLTHHCPTVVLTDTRIYSGVGNRHVQTHEFAGWPQDDGGNQESDKFWSAAARPLHWSDTGGRPLPWLFWLVYQEHFFFCIGQDICFIKIIIIKMIHLQWWWNSFRFVSMEAKRLKGRFCAKIKKLSHCLIYLTEYVGTNSPSALHLVWPIYLLNDFWCKCKCSVFPVMLLSMECTRFIFHSHSKHHICLKCISLPFCTHQRLLHRSVSAGGK